MVLARADILSMENFSPGEQSETFPALFKYLPSNDMFKKWKTSSGAPAAPAVVAQKIPQGSPSIMPQMPEMTPQTGLYQRAMDQARAAKDAAMKKNEEVMRKVSAMEKNS